MTSLINDNNNKQEMNPVEKKSPPKIDNIQDMSLQEIIRYIKTWRIDQLNQKSADKLKELGSGQSQVKAVHALMNAIKAAAKNSKEEEFVVTQSLIDAVEVAKGISPEFEKVIVNLGFKDLEANKTKLNKKDMLESCKIAADDFGMDNETKVQESQKFQSLIQEVYHFLRTIEKTLADTLRKLATNIKG